MYLNLVTWHMSHHGFIDNPDNIVDGKKQNEYRRFLQETSKFKQIVENQPASALQMIHM